MKQTVTGRHVEITSDLRDLIDRKLEKLKRLLNDSAVSAQVILSQEHHSCTAEIALHAHGDHVLRGAGEDPTWSRAINVAVDKVDQRPILSKENGRRGAGDRPLKHRPTGNRLPSVYRGPRHARLGQATRWSRLRLLNVAPVYDVTQ